MRARCLPGWIRKTHYDVLDVSSTADLAEIKKAHLDFARHFHRIDFIRVICELN
jgi:hypothetical protein